MTSDFYEPGLILQVFRVILVPLVMDGYDQPLPPCVHTDLNRFSSIHGTLSDGDHPKNLDDVNYEDFNNPHKAQLDFFSCHQECSEF